MDSIIQIKNLCKSFGSVKAVNDISFTVEQGQLFAFLGVNGAGKSTTISMICGRLKRDSGDIIIDGKTFENDPEHIKKSLGVVFQNSVLDKPLTSLDNLRSRAALYGITGKAFQKRLKEISEMLELDELLNRPVEKLSGGQCRRIDIARAIFHKPKILILDEPTTGLDPQTRKAVWKTVETLRKNENMTVFLTTHYMEEAADADNVIILDSGKIVAKGTPLELKNKYTGDFITLYTDDENSVSRLGVNYEKLSEGFRIAVPDTYAATKLIISNPEIFRDYEIIKGRLDDVFLAVTGKKGE